MKLLIQIGAVHRIICKFKRNKIMDDMIAFTIPTRYSVAKYNNANDDDSNC